MKKKWPSGQGQQDSKSKSLWAVSAVQLESGELDFKQNVTFLYKVMRHQQGC